MKKYTLIAIFLCLIIAVAFSKQFINVYCKSKLHEKTIKNISKDCLRFHQSIKPIIYLDDEVDTIMISKNWRNKCLSFIV